MLGINFSFLLQIHNRYIRWCTYFKLSRMVSRILVPDHSSSALSRKPNVHRPVTTNFVYSSGNAVSNPTIPNGASCMPLAFSSALCGAWSVTIISIVPSSKPFDTGFTSRGERSGGFIFQLASKPWNIFIRQEQVMRAYLSGYLYANLLCKPNKSYRLLGTNMANMVMNASRFCQQNIPADMNRFGFIRNPFKPMLPCKITFRNRMRLPPANRLHNAQ